MNKKTTFLLGLVMIIIGISITVLFDIQPIIPSAITLLGLGTITVTVSRALAERRVENE